MISIKQLNYALAVEKTLHFKKAAELCHVSQSALSTALSELESQLKIQIFERDNKKVLVTPVGREVLQRARRIMNEVDDLHHLSDEQQSPLSFPITIGLIPTIAPYLLPRLYPALREHYPNSQVNVKEEQSAVLVDMVRSGEIDSAILALPYPCDGLLTIEFYQEDFYWITTSGQETQNGNEIKSEDINSDELLLLKEGHCLKDHILDACKFNNDSDSQRLDATSLHTLVQMVKANLGSTLVPAMSLSQLVDNDHDLTAVHLNEPSPHRRLAFIMRPNFTRMSSIEALKLVCSEALANQSLPQTLNKSSKQPL
jgi:LysR family transcriptional regulator, hydrogen peroxide-inducible genes activator